MDDVRNAQTEDGKRKLTDGEKHATRERQSLALARARVLHLLEESENERYKDLLRQQLSELDKKMNGSRSN